MTIADVDALGRAVKAVRRAHDGTDSFDRGRLSPEEIMDVIEFALREEFAPHPKEL
jgi:hypothetical protein